MMGQWLCGYGNVSGLFIINAKNFESRAKIILLDFFIFGPSSISRAEPSAHRAGISFYESARCSSLQYRSRIGTTSRSDFLKMSLHSGQDAVALAGINNLVFLTFLLTKILDIQLWQ